MASDSEKSNRPVAVIGGGITGLSAAYRLTQLGFPVRLFEASARMGGVIKTESVDGWLIENGPNSFHENSREISSLIDELGLKAEVVVADPAAKNRYIVRDGKLRALPRSPLGLFRTPLFSGGSKWRLLKELFRRPIQRDADLSLASFIAHHFGQEFVDYALNPFVSGVYAGDPMLLSAKYAFPSLWSSERTSGSIIRGFLAQAKLRKQRGDPKTRVISFRRGLGTLVEALAQKLPPGTVQLKATLRQIEADPSWSLRWSPAGSDRLETETFAAVIAALPAYALAKLPLPPPVRSFQEKLAAVDYPPVASLFLGFRREQVAHSLSGFGLLIPSAERRKILGVIFSSSLFQGRAPDGHVSVTVMLGGARRREVARLTEEEASREIIPELSELLGIKGGPVFGRFTVWPRAIPQYNLGHESTLEAIASIEESLPGLQIGGQIKDGIALPACVQAGFRLAERTAKARQSQI